MTANEVKDLLSEADIMNLLNELGGEPKKSGSVIISRTICHNDAHQGHHKLMYYLESKTFYCYTSCKKMDIYGLIGKIMNLGFFESFKYICMKFGLSMSSEKTAEEYVDMSFFRKFHYEELQEAEFNTIPMKALQCFTRIYPQSWIDEGISIRSMKKFGIHFSILFNQIILPHFDKVGNLIGIRARNQNEELVSQGKKYMPVFLRGHMMNHATGSNLYGLNLNMESIRAFKIVILFESEKAVMQLDSMWPDKSIGVCISGSFLSDYQIKLLEDLDIEEIVIAVDKEYEKVDSDEARYYAEKIQSSFSNKLIAKYKVSVIWDMKDLLKLKDSPTDRGKEVFEQLMADRIYL